MEKAKIRMDLPPRNDIEKPKQKATKQPPRKERCHLHGVIRGGRFYLE